MNEILESAIEIDILRPEDVPAALGLCRQAGWNQLAADWMRLIDYEPHGCFAARCAGQLVGTVTTTRFGTQLAWIGMMLVDANHRRRGIAMALMRRSIAYLESHRVACIKLDATPVGESVYRQLGFEVEWRFHRWRKAAVVGEARGIVTTEPASLPPALWELDREAFGMDRRRFLERMLADSKLLITQDGYGALRPGYLASYLGPIAARTPGAARQIVETLLAATTGEVFWDIPGPNREAAALAHRCGFEAVRELARMWRGAECGRMDAGQLYALADPSVG